MPDTDELNDILEDVSLGLMLEESMAEFDWTFGSDGIADGIRAIHNEHDRLVNERGVGLFFGTDSSFRQTLRLQSERTARIRELLTDGSDARTVAGTLKTRGCVGWVIFDGARIAFEVVGYPDQYEAILAETRRDDFRVTTMMRSLRTHGRFQLVQIGTGHKRTREKYLAGVDDHATELNDAIIDELSTDPFLVGATPGGRHAYMGYSGKINECHWDQGPGSTNLFEEHDLGSFLSKQIERHGAAFLARPPSITETKLSDLVGDFL